MSTERSALALCLDVLGPLTLRVDGQEVEVPGARRRALLALLALEAGRVASTERLVDCLWPDEPPENAVQAIYSHISGSAATSVRTPTGSSVGGAGTGWSSNRTSSTRMQLGGSPAPWPRRVPLLPPPRSWPGPRWRCGGGGRWRSSAAC